MKPLAITVIHPDGTESATEASFEAARAAVGGYLEAVWLTNGGCLLVDEDGLSKGLRANVRASTLARRTIVGPAAVVPQYLVKTVLD